MPRSVRANAAAQKITRAKVPLELEKFNNDSNLPMNTFSPKKTFKGTVK